MKRRRTAGDKVFLCVNAAGQVVITPAAAHEKAMESLGLDRGKAPSVLKVGEIGTAGRLKLPPEFLSYLR